MVGGLCIDLQGNSTSELLRQMGVNDVPIYPVKGYVVEVPYKPGALVSLLFVSRVLALD